MIHRVECRMEEGVGSGSGGEFEFAGCDMSKGTIRFPVDKPSPATLEKLLGGGGRGAEERGRVRARGLRHVERYDPLPCGQAFAGNSGEKAGEGGGRRE